MEERLQKPAALAICVAFTLVRPPSPLLFAPFTRGFFFFFLALFIYVALAWPLPMARLSKKESWTRSFFLTVPYFLLLFHRYTGDCC